MAFYLVGKDNGTFFKKRTTWDLDVALEMAVDGDTIEIESDYVYDGKDSLIIDKSISLIGHHKIAEDGDENQIIQPYLYCGVHVKNQSTVRLENLYLVTFSEKRNTLRVKEQSTVTVVATGISNEAEEGENYPIIYVDEGSSLNMMDSWVDFSKLTNHQFYVGNANLILESCVIGPRLIINNSRFTIKDCDLRNRDGNALQVKNKSEGLVQTCTIDGGGAEKDYPCIVIQESKVRIETTRVIQPQYTAALSVWDSQIELSDSVFDSITIRRTQLKSDNLISVKESFFLYDHSRLEGKAPVIEGLENGKINFYANAESQVSLNRLIFGQLTNPTVKVERNVKFDVAKLLACQYDFEKEEFAKTDNGDFVVRDVVVALQKFGEKTSYELLEEMIGLESVKRGVKEFIAINKLNKRREQQGYATSFTTMHALFLGNPGTGKTTVARLIGRLLKEEGLIEKGQFIEVSRSNLVGEYIGETAIKTREVLESALGGILFIDEAYTLASQDNSRDFGLEAINEILKFMEDHRRDIVIIFAGYTKNMEDFLKMNEGLRSRIPNSFNFEDYTVPQLVKIGLDELRAQGYNIDDEQYADLVEYKHQLTNDNSNGRWVRNLNESLLRTLAINLLDYPNKDMNHIDNDVIAMVKSR